MAQRVAVDGDEKSEIGARVGVSDDESAAISATLQAILCSHGASDALLATLDE